MSGSASPEQLLADAWVSAQIDAALAPYVGRVSAAQLAWMREQLAEQLANDRYASSVLRRAHPRATERSGDTRSPLAEPLPAKRRTKG